ncbi:MAG: excinuclease ABC subunit UvrC [Verrucomicrobiota bacterium]
MQPAEGAARLEDWKIFPRSPGVYIMEDGRGKVLYVGKAKELRARLRNYAVPGGDGRPTIPHLLPRVRGVRCIVTTTEKEALLLENTLIKRHRPPFNVFFRDDKEYLLLRIDPREEFPRPELVRRAARDGATYFGPFSSARGIRETVRELLRLFPLCSCSRKKFSSRRRPCLNYQMGRCLGACAGKVPRERYLPVVENAMRFLRGEYRGLLAAWKAEMEALSREMRYEEAARLRDRIAVVSRTLVRQRVVRAVEGDVDAVGWYRDDGAATAAVLYLRSGRVTDAHQRHFRWEGSEEEGMASFLLQHYAEGAYFPREILLPFPLPDRAALSAALAERAGHPVTLRVPEKGERARLVEMARRNAVESDRMRREKEVEYGRLAGRMASLFSLPRVPVRIEGYDISNLSGTEAVGSMVVFAGGKPAKKWYRKFAVRGVVGQDDFAMMEEVVRRRFAHGDDFGGSPDLVVIDGGKGQLSSALAALRSAGKEGIPVLSLAKERVRGGEKIFRERVFLPGRKNPLHLPAGDPALHLLMRVRDEAHRFAVVFHRARRTRRTLGA